MVVTKAAGSDVLAPEKGYRSSSLLERRRRVLVARSFTEKPNGSNSIETKLSRVNWRTEIKLCTILGDTRTFCKTNGREEI